MEHVISATEARIHFGELMRRVVNNQEPVIVERGGKPQVVIISVTEYEQWKAERQRSNAQSALELAAQSRARIAARLGNRSLPPADEIIRTGREERGEQLTGLR